MSSFLTERLSFDQAGMKVELAESVDAISGFKPIYMKGIFVQGGTRNHNGRIYPVSEINRAVELVNNQISEGFSICGEADHPEELNINLDRISHIITQMWMDGPNGMGKLQVLPTPMGNIVRTLLESGVKLGVSSRGSGNVDNYGQVSDFEIVTVDIVARPSAPNAYPKMVYEALNDKRGAIIDSLSRDMANDPKAQKFLAQELREWINKL